jgi:hypothetical protein
MRTQASAAAAKPATRSRKSGSTKKSASAAKALTKAKAKPKTTGKANGVAAAAATTSNRGARSAAGTKSQAAKPGKKRSAGKSQQRASRAGTRKASSQSGAAPQHQGEGTMSPHAQAPMFGGTRQVLIEEVAMTNRGGRKQGPEPYPFAILRRAGWTAARSSAPRSSSGEREPEADHRCRPQASQGRRQGFPHATDGRPFGRRSEREGLGHPRVARARGIQRISPRERGWERGRLPREAASFLYDLQFSG